MPKIHQTALVGPKVELAGDVEIGPYSIIEGEVKIGRGTKIGSHVFIEGFTSIGENCHIFTGAAIGSQSKPLRFCETAWWRRQSNSNPSPFREDESGC